MQTLSGYITQVRRLVKDASANFYSSIDLTDYINEARTRVVQDTGCLRTLQTLTLTANQEEYAFASLPAGNVMIDALNISVINGNLRYDLKYLPWTELNSNLRQYTNFVGIPAFYSKYGQGSIFIGPVPDQNYPSEWDTVILPNPLVSDLTPEQLADPYGEPVKYYAAYLAKYNEQSYGEADVFKKQYGMSINQIIASTGMRRILSNAFRY